MAQPSFRARVRHGDRFATKVYLDENERRLVESLATRDGLPLGEVLRRGLSMYAAEAQPERRAEQQLVLTRAGE